MRVYFTLKIDFGIKATDRETRVRRGAHAARRHASPWLTRCGRKRRFTKTAFLGLVKVIYSRCREIIYMTDNSWAQTYVFGGVRLGGRRRARALGGRGLHIHCA